MQVLLNYNILWKVLGWTIFWLTLYKSFLKIFCKKSNEHNCRIVTLLHAITITACSCYITFFNGTNPFQVIGFPNTNLQFLVLSSSLGYFLFDFTWCLYHQTEGVIMLLHHVISVTFMSVCLYLGVSGTEVVATIFGSEVTSIVLNIRWFLKHYNLYNGLIGMLVDIVFFGMFLGVRLGVGGYLNYRVLISDLPPLLIKIGGFIFYIVNCLFFFQIVSFLRYRIRKWNQKHSNEVTRHKDSNGVTSVFSNGKHLENKKAH